MARKVGNISYFCIVKRLKSIFIILAVCVFMLISNKSSANDDTHIIQQMDSVEISLLTCQPHPEIYSLYGHTAIRYRDKSTSTDLAVNYGMFSFEEPFFALRFLFGSANYEMGIESFESFCNQYRRYGSEVKAQVLNLTREEKYRIFEAIKKNYLPENRAYRYNYYYKNCTTCARDILLYNIDGVVVFNNKKEDVSFRELIHSCNKDYPWAALGNDLLLGFESDFKRNYKEQQFLPVNLKNDFDNAVIRDKHGRTRNLVLRTETVVQPGVQIIEKEFPLSPLQTSLVLLFIVLLSTLFEYKRKKILWIIDVLLMTFSGIAGIFIFLMLFSKLPTVNLNLQILLLNPIPLFFIFQATKDTIRHKRNKWWVVWSILIILGIIGSLFQDYAEGMINVALVLLLRCMLHIYIDRKKINEE